MRLLTRAEWDALQQEREPLDGEGLMAYAERVEPIRHRQREENPGVDFSNGRYEVHVERALMHGIAVPQDVLDSLRRDCFDCPLVCERIGIESHEAYIRRLRQSESAGVGL